MENLSGHLLLASPQLADPNFARAIVLLIQHNAEGALGVVLNRPTSKTVRDLWQQVGQEPCESLRPVHLGGPVAGPLMALHANPDLAEIEIIPGVFFAAQKVHLDTLVNQDAGHFKVFVGNSGWGPGQLESEIHEGAWHVLSANADDIFDDADDLWQRLLDRAQGTMLPTLLKIKHIPPDPSMN